jgi:hypothetical protein
MITTKTRILLAILLVSKLTSATDYAPLNTLCFHGMKFDTGLLRFRVIGRGLLRKNRSGKRFGMNFLKSLVSNVGRLRRLKNL